MPAWIDGAPASLDDAVAAAATLLAEARAPVIAGLAADVAGIQAALRLGERLGASLDPAGAEGLYADLGALATGGAMTTTPRETIARADLVLAVGSRAAASDLFREAGETRPDTGRAAGAERRVLRLDQASDQLALQGAVGELRAIAAGRMALHGPVAEMALAVREARFGVALYDPGELGELGIGMLHGLAADLSAAHRFFALSLAEPWAGRAAQQVTAWHAAQPPRLGFGRGRAEHDPWRFDAARQIAEGEADAALWLASLPASHPAWKGAVPTVAVMGDPQGNEGAVTIRVAVPGVGAGGVIWDGGTGQLAYHEATAPDDAPEAAAVLAAIGARIETIRSGAC